MPVNSPGAAHEETSPHRQITHTLRDGTQAMRAAGTLYLPQEPKESSTAYGVRLARSVLTNVYTKTADTFIGRITKKNAPLLDSTPTQIQDIEDDINNAGDDLMTVVKRALKNAVDDGIVYFLVDSPQFIAPTIENEEGEEEPVERTRGMDEDQGLRPFVNLITHDNMLFTRYGEDNKLEMIRYQTFDERVDPDDEFGAIVVPQVQVLDIPAGTVRRRTYERISEEEAKEELWEQVGPDVVTEFEEIPLVTLNVNEIRRDVGMPLFIDLANLNIRHWQSASDQANIAHVMRVPILFAVGLVDEATQRPQNITIAANSVVHGEPGATLEFVEHTGKAVELGQIELDSIASDMVKMGTEIVLNKSTGNTTATARALDQAESDTLMVAVAGAVENAIAEVFVHLAIAFGEQGAGDSEQGAGGINLNKDFNIASLDSNVIAQLVQIWTGGGLSLETFWQEMQRYGLLSEDFDAEAEQGKIEADKDKSLEREASMMQLVADITPADDEEEEEVE